jgi:hypothetical protein
VYRRHGDAAAGLVDSLDDAVLALDGVRRLGDELAWRLLPQDVAPLPVCAMSMKSAAAWLRARRIRDKVRRVPARPVRSANPSLDRGDARLSIFELLDLERELDAGDVLLQVA